MEGTNRVGQRPWSPVFFLFFSRFPRCDDPALLGSPKSPRCILSCARNLKQHGFVLTQSPCCVFGRGRFVCCFVPKFCSVSRAAVLVTSHSTDFEQDRGLPSLSVAKHPSLCIAGLVPASCCFSSSCVELFTSFCFPAWLVS